MSKNRFAGINCRSRKAKSREIVRKINGLIVKWRIANSEKGENETFDLLAGLINETISDRVSKGKLEYREFLIRLEWTPGDEDTVSYGKNLADGLRKTQRADNHVDKVRLLKAAFKKMDSAIMNSLIDILDKDEHLCNVLNSRQVAGGCPKKPIAKKCTQLIRKMKPWKKVWKSLRRSKRAPRAPNLPKHMHPVS
ncbi:MAG: hypothetical protein H6629_17370 [Calditrichae bacterium]|nr:hypothetical protein [Calditrichia bacterium]